MAAIKLGLNYSRNSVPLRNTKDLHIQAYNSTIFYPTSILCNLLSRYFAFRTLRSPIPSQAVLHKQCILTALRLAVVCKTTFKLAYIHETWCKDDAVRFNPITRFVTVPVSQIQQTLH
jgi:hypothetical protein